jgi:hypothetical protein
METCRNGDTETWIQEDMRHGDMYMETWRQQTEMEAQAILLLDHRANESLLFVRLLMKKQTEVICLQTD